jgi:hypothetical protein
MNQQIKDSITIAVNVTQGIKYQVLEANLLCQFLSVSQAEIHSTIEGMIIDCKVREIQYEIPGYGIISYLIPGNSRMIL